MVWDAIINGSRFWANAVKSLTMAEDGTPVDSETRRGLIIRHLAWLNVLAF